jgi:hypothetical protein
MDRRADATGSSESPVPVTVGPAAADVRRALGPMAWCALEMLATTPADDGEPWVVRTSVRDVAARIGVATNTAQRALAVLRHAGFIAAVQRRGCTGRFGSGAYRLTVDPDVLRRQPRAMHTAINDTASTRQGAPQRPAPRTTAARAQQLALLPPA